MKIFTEWMDANPIIMEWLDPILVIFACIVVYYLSRTYLIRLIKVLSKRSKSKIDDVILEQGVLSKLSYLGPLIILHQYIEVLPDIVSRYQPIISALIIFIMLAVTGSLLNALYEIYSGLAISKKFPLKSYLQVVKIFIYIIGTLVIISILIGKSPLVLLSGLGALTAVLMLVFRDTILSFVASMQISTSDLVKVGDWVESPTFGADGDVIDIALHHIKIQNWDKTISTIPTHKMIDSSFKNWRGMSSSGGRRVKRSIHIDINSIKFCTQEMLDRFSRIHYISEYIQSKSDELTQYNNQDQSGMDELVNGRRMTNIGTFRAYIISYLRNHPNVRQDMTLLVRQLQSTDTGLPIQLYFFTNTVDWIDYENIQSDIFDHIMAALNGFDLSVYQSPTGSDFNKLSGN
ncbi:MAG: mechanosensitive ion channel [Candidatus Marinimicrobia bacterium]|jgi:miniconductance mechanosensitive channel|nr:mechanosensitive ion channel [Candidatus Neomarinimicrobiota bacterium]MBT3633491.1 mechanosensitive ion channel [Candidatus Neomarinimicrobiota bacterium]MBT3681633.1 mechanosensitive ion channel [Candidatus Neomarinimicrobiota bacterium]MBT3758399.1 mechanosensitive ion channel [Candidatus Neomarinimicrobiota bacterium]MBT3894947.1 mechanosensitive ion channel [Candidatus Neomarinimicrobiota bacterium]